eukprot:14983871-Ditylum_brightwellii.AAC.1
MRKGRKEIERLLLADATHILGVWMAPSGQNNTQVEKLLTITDTWVNRVRSGHIRKDRSWDFYKSTIKKNGIPISSNSADDGRV